MATFFKHVSHAQAIAKNPDEDPVLRERAHQFLREYQKDRFRQRINDAVFKELESFKSDLRQKVLLLKNPSIEDFLKLLE